MKLLITANTDLQLSELLLVFFALFALYQPGLADLTINLIKGFPQGFTLQLSFGWFNAVVYQPLVPFYDLTRVFTGLASIVMLALKRLKLSLAFYLAGIFTYIGLMRIVMLSNGVALFILAHVLLYSYFAIVILLPTVIAYRLSRSGSNKSSMLVS